MVPVSKYVDVSHPDMKGKTDFELWELLNHDAKMIVVTEYMGDCLKEALVGVADRIAEGLRRGVDNAKSAGEVAQPDRNRETPARDTAAPAPSPETGTAAPTKRVL